MSCTLILDVKNRNFVKILELHIGRADLEGFVCEVLYSILYSYYSYIKVTRWLSVCVVCTLSFRKLVDYYGSPLQPSFMLVNRRVYNYFWIVYLQHSKKIAAQYILFLKLKWKVEGRCNPLSLDSSRSVAAINLSIFLWLSEIFLFIEHFIWV